MLDKRSELELKLLVQPDFQIPPLDGNSIGVARVTEREPLQLSAVYFDTPDLRLMRRGITLRHRIGDDGGPLWTLKLPVNGGDGMLRSEIEFSGDSGEPPAEARAALFGVVNGGALGPVAEIKTRRRRWALSAADGADLAELVDDRVSILDGNDIRDTFREIEIEAHQIDRKGLRQIADVMCRAGALPEQRSKASRALEALRGSLPRMPSEGRPVPNDPVGKAVAPALAGALDRLLIYDPYARLGEAEGVHQLRVAGRRLRTVLRTFAPLLDPQKVEAAHAQLRWLGQALSDVRDLDVLAESLQEQARDVEATLAPVFETLAVRRAAAGEALAQALASDRYAALVQHLTDLTNDPTFVENPGGPCETELPDLAWRMWRRLQKAAVQLDPNSPEAEFHRARILAKRARYAAETISECMSPKLGKRLRRFAEGAESVQNVLGDHLDATFARETLLGLAEQYQAESAVSFALGRVVERYDQIAKDKRRQFFDEWSKFNRQRNLEWANR